MNLFVIELVLKVLFEHTLMLVEIDGKPNIFNHYWHDARFIDDAQSLIPGQFQTFFKFFNLNYIQFYMKFKKSIEKNNLINYSNCECFLIALYR
jgi:hypothetical protein